MHKVLKQLYGFFKVLIETNQHDTEDANSQYNELISELRRITAELQKAHSAQDTILTHLKELDKRLYNAFGILYRSGLQAPKLTSIPDHRYQFTSSFYDYNYHPNSIYDSTIRNTIDQYHGQLSETCQLIQILSQSLLTQVYFRDELLKTAITLIRRKTPPPSQSDFDWLGVSRSERDSFRNLAATSFDLPLGVYDEYFVPTDHREFRWYTTVCSDDSLGNKQAIVTSFDLLAHYDDDGRLRARTHHRLTSTCRKLSRSLHIDCRTIDRDTSDLADDYLTSYEYLSSKYRRAPWSPTINEGRDRVRSITALLEIVLEAYELSQTRMDDLLRRSIRNYMTFDSISKRLANTVLQTNVLRPDPYAGLGGSNWLAIRTKDGSPIDDRMLSEVGYVEIGRLIVEHTNLISIPITMPIIGLHGVGNLLITHSLYQNNITVDNTLNRFFERTIYGFFLRCAPGLLSVHIADLSYRGLAQRFKYLYPDDIGNGSSAIKEQFTKGYDEDYLVSLLDRLEEQKRKLAEQVYDYRSIVDMYSQSLLGSPHYHLVVIRDLPDTFSLETLERLCSLMENSSRLGLFFLMYLSRGQMVRDRRRDDRKRRIFARIGTLADTTICDLSGLVESMLRLRLLPNYAFRFKPQKLEDGRMANTLLRHRAAVILQSDRSFEVFHKPDTMWESNSVNGSSAIVAASSSRSLAIRFDDYTPHAYITGNSGSGKSTLLMTLIHSLAWRYSPKDVAISLIDLKHAGPTFRDFRHRQRYSLPHVTSVCISGQEESIRVIDSVRHEIARRASLFRTVSVLDYKAYRVTGADLPRLVLIIDELQELFTAAHRSDDDIGIRRKAADSLGYIVAQGRSFGIHVVLATLGIASTAPSAIAIEKRITDQCSTRLDMRNTSLNSKRQRDDYRSEQTVSGPGDITIKLLGDPDSELGGRVIVPTGGNNSEMYGDVSRRIRLMSRSDISGE